MFIVFTDNFDGTQIILAKDAIMSVTEADGECKDYRVVTLRNHDKFYIAETMDIIKTNLLG